MNGSLWQMLGKGVLGRGATAFSALLLTLFLPTVLEAEAVGKIYFSLSVAALLSTFSRWGVDNSTNEKVAHVNGEEEVKVKASIILAGMAGVVIFSIVWFLLGRWGLSIFGVEIMGEGVLGIAFLSAALAFSYILFQLYRIDGYILWGALTRGFFVNIVLISVLFLMPFFGGVSSTDQVLVWWGGGTLAFSLMNLVFYSKKNSISIKKPEKDLVFSLFSSRFFGYALLLYFITDADYYFIQTFMNSEDLAVYASMKRLAVMVAIYTDVAHLILPSVYKNNVKADHVEAAIKVFRQLSVLGFVLSIVIAVGAFLFLGDLSSMFWPENYLSGIPALTIMLSGFALSMSFGFSEMWLLLKGDKNALLFSMIGALSICLLSNSFLTPRYGIIGAALSFSFSNIVLRLGLSLYVMKKYRVCLMMWWR